MVDIIETPDMATGHKKTEEVAIPVQPLVRLIKACLHEACQKHACDPINDADLNQDYHLEITLTVGEIKAAAKALGIKDWQ